MAGLYYEQFFVGQEFEHPWTRTVTEMDNVLFTNLTMNVADLEQQNKSLDQRAAELTNALAQLNVLIEDTRNKSYGARIN